MGGAKGGREASQGACNVMEQVFQEQYAQCGAGQEGAFLKKALISANRYVFNKAAHEESLPRPTVLPPQTTEYRPENWP